MMIRETYVNETRGHIIGEGDWYEPFTDNLGELFRSLQKEYGGCVSSSYRDQKDGPPIRTGWVFSRREEYDDARADWPKERRTYVREVWVEVSATPVRMVTRQEGYSSPF